MSRAQRLLDLIDLLRRHRFPVAGSVLAHQLGISLRTLYRDIATLQEQGADIEGEPGLGYVLRPGFLLPPLMFSEDELEALVLGARWVAGHGDRRLADAATSALARVSAVLPDELRGALESNGLMVASRRVQDADAEVRDEQLARIRAAIRRSRKLALAYHDATGAPSQRLVWPIALGYFEQAPVLVAWCELRADFRHFRCDRIAALDTLDAGYPRGRQALLREWRAYQDRRDKVDAGQPCIPGA